MSDALSWKQLNEKAVELFSQRRLDEAESMFRSALQSKRRLAPSASAPASGAAGDTDEAMMLSNLGVLYRHQDRLALSAEHFEQALRIYESSPASDDSQLAKAMTDLAKIYTDLYQQRQQQPPPSPSPQGSAPSMEPIDFHSRQADLLTKAERLCRRAWRSHERAVLSDPSRRSDSVDSGVPLNQDAAACLLLLAQVCHLQGKATDAERFYLLALQMARRLYGPASVPVASVMTSLAALLAPQKQRLHETKQLYMDAMDILRRHQHPSMLHAMQDYLSVLAMHAGQQPGDVLNTDAVNVLKDIVFNSGSGNGGNSETGANTGSPNGKDPSSSSS